MSLITCHSCGTRSCSAQNCRPGSAECRQECTKAAALNPKHHQFVPICEYCFDPPPTAAEMATVDAKIRPLLEALTSSSAPTPSQASAA
jgi:hypothetical protein